MDPKLISEKQLVAAAKAIIAAGPGEVSERIFKQIVLPGAGHITTRNIAIANLVAKLSPARHASEWYVTALFRGTSKYLHPSRTPEDFAVQVLTEAGIPPMKAIALKEIAEPESDIYECSDLALAIVFSDLCTTPKGTYTSFSEKSTSGVGRENISDTAYMLSEVNYLLGQRGLKKKYEEILEKEIRKGGTENVRTEKKKRALGQKQICPAP